MRRTSRFASARAGSHGAVRTQKMRDFWYYGLRLRTNLPLEGLPPWPGEPDVPDLVLRAGAVPERLPGSPETSKIFAFNEEGHVLVSIANVFRLLSFDESRFLIEVTPEATIAAIESYLLSHIAGLVLHRRRILPLHATCVMIEGRALVICGHSGRGKSTLATALTRLGHTLLSDDITAIRFDAKGTAFAIPGSPHSRLRRDSIIANAIDAESLRDAREGDDKMVLRRELRHFEPTPVAAVIRLDLAAPSEGPGIERLNGPKAVLPLAELVYRCALGRKLGAASEIANGALRLAAAAPILRLTRPQGLETLDLTVSLVLASFPVMPR